MTKNRLIVGLAAAAIAAGSAGLAYAIEYPINKPRSVGWSFSGPFGMYERQQLQRGFQVYREACATCHGLDLVAFRNLTEPGGPGFTVDEVRALAAEYQILDGPDERGEMFERPGRPSDRFPPPYPNERAARAAHSGAFPVDLSLITKAREVKRGFPTFVFDFFTQYQESGADYVYSLLTGYQDPPLDMEVPPGTYYNPYFIAGTAIAMPPPLSDGQIAYAQNQDDNPATDVPETVEQYALDVTAFLAWTAEPHMEHRKRLGFSVMVFLVLFAGLVFYTKQKVWQDVGH